VQRSIAYFSTQDRHVTPSSNRAAGLTRQLLVFSRKQLLRPEVIDPDDAVKDLDKLLGRLIDQRIKIAIVSDTKTGRVKADAGHLGQVLMNLVLNARDAMPDGGKISIETENVTVGEEYTKKRTDNPGDYVMLSLSDTGTGMTEEVQAHLFEPFFTTKQFGTGLGLVTCRTIVQQFNGHIDVYSELGKGTTFKIYLPRVEQLLEVTTGTSQPPPLPRGTETLRPEKRCCRS
jgi:two-component system, cell cycle sensor histidine kinase and response regulator CckA